MKTKDEVIFCRFTYRGRPVRSMKKPDLLLRIAVGLFVPTRLIAPFDADMVEIYTRSALPGSTESEKTRLLLERQAYKNGPAWGRATETIRLAPFPETMEEAWRSDALPLSDLTQILQQALCAQPLSLGEAIETSEEELLVEILKQLDINPAREGFLTRDETRLLILLMYENSAREAARSLFACINRDAAHGQVSREMLRRAAEYGEDVFSEDVFYPAEFYFALDSGADSLPWKDQEEEDDADLPF